MIGLGLNPDLAGSVFHLCTKVMPRNECADLSFGKTKFVLQSFHGVPPKPTGSYPDSAFFESVQWPLRTQSAGRIAFRRNRRRGACAKSATSFSFGIPQPVLRYKSWSSKHQPALTVPSAPRRENRGRRKPQKIWKPSLLVCIYCNPLKSHKTTNTFFGKAWHWNHRNLEKLAGSLEVNRLLRVKIRHAPASRDRHARDGRRRRR